MRRLQTLEKRPTHDSHEGFRFERLSSLNFELDLAAVQSLVTGLAQRDEIIPVSYTHLRAHET